MNDWIWCGAQHHFIGDCRFHLATWVDDGRYLVSTVGEYYPSARSAPDVPETIGVGRHYETFVFKCDTTEPLGCGGYLMIPHEVDSEGVYCDDEDWAKAGGEATTHHLAMCRKWGARREW